MLAVSNGSMTRPSSRILMVLVALLYGTRPLSLPLPCDEVLRRLNRSLDRQQDKWHHACCFIPQHRRDPLRLESEILEYSSVLKMYSGVHNGDGVRPS